MKKTSTEQTLRQVRGQINIWIADTKVTRLVSAWLLVWYLITHYVPLGIDESTTTYLFFATANPSPGWILAMFSHAGIVHLLGNIGLLLLFGIIVERRIETRQYLTFLFTTGLITTLFQVLEYNINGITGGMVGASGATFSVVTFALVALLRSPTDTHRDLIIAAIIILIGQLLNDFTSYLSVSQKASGVVHLSGMIIGATFALYHTRR
jgi:membrane associated rhomboid family serine protease